jgi:hypothetical protein
MEPMRRLLVLVAALGALPAITGCWQHTAGYCDCRPPIQPCCIYGLYPAEAHPAVPPAHAQPPVVPVVPVAPINQERLGAPREGL